MIKTTGPVEMVKKAGHVSTVLFGVMGVALLCQTWSSEDPFFLAAVLGAWWLVEFVLRFEAQTRFGYDDVDSCPRWRCVLGFWTQLIVLPVLFGMYSMCGSQWACDAFALVFAIFMVEDLVILNIAPLYFWHHLACLLGLGVALYSPEGFECFFFSVVSLEVGSALCNLYLIHPPTQATALMYVLSMTASNMFALAGYWQYANHSVIPASIRAFAGFETLVLICFRQNACIQPEMRCICWGGTGDGGGGTFLLDCVKS
jgi:hypothetical protein